MASPLAKGISTAIKRTRSQDSLQRSDTPASNKASKTDETSEQSSSETRSETSLNVPAFLRQSKPDINAKFNELNWQEKIRIIQGRDDPESLWFQDSSPNVLQRNRYLGVQPWDKTRIRLNVGVGTSDYINASPISLVDPSTSLETKYIATQGPKKSGVSHFWYMIWHETKDVAVVVMLTPTEESGREKCYQYFPLDSESEPLRIKFGGSEQDLQEGTVTFVESEELYGPSTQVRKLHLTFGSETRVVWHLLFTAFPDFGVPEDEDRAELLALLKLSAKKNSESTNPRTVHCSAGVGRSGTFIALDYLLSALESGTYAQVEEGDDPVYDIVSQLRAQRMMMVQSDVQYQFLYDVMLEEVEKRGQHRNPEQSSPKLRKLNAGMKAAVLDEIEPIIQNGTPVIKINEVEAEPHTGDSADEEGDVRKFSTQPEMAETPKSDSGNLRTDEIIPTQGLPDPSKPLHGQS